MKLRNKKTGEIGYLLVGKGSNYYIVTNDEWEDCGKYDSLSELNEDWEDASEEPKDNNYWYIDDLGRIQFSSEVLDEIEGHPNNWMSRKIFGNYFSSREEAEKAVEKLKAWKRLKDKGFCFESWFGGSKIISFRIGELIDEDIAKDLNLLFRS
jgi:hypothetical protein